jgi:serine/threonine protein kinase
MDNFSWSESTLSDPLNLSKTAWPVPRFEAIFLPEFQVREVPLKNDYIFIDIISNGAYGRVYKVQKRETKEIFALKIISKAKIVAENAVQQAKQEVNTDYYYFNSSIIKMIFDYYVFMF